MIFFVKDSRNKTLYPSTKIDWAEKIVKRGKAKWVRRKIIILQLAYIVDDAPRDMLSRFVLGMDPGYKHIGVALFKITGDKKLLIFKGTYDTRSHEIKDLMAERKMYRQIRRANRRDNKNSNKFRHPRWKNRRGCKWNPTHLHIIRSHVNLVSFIEKYMPIHIINLEYASFDITKLTNTKATNHIGNNKAFALYRDGYQCQVPKCKNEELQVHHITYRSNGGSDNHKNLITLCRKCHDKVHKGKLQCPAIDTSRNNRSTAINTVMPEILYQLSEKHHVELTYGYLTKQRRQSMGLDKTHSNDAIAIGLLEVSDSYIDFNINMKMQSSKRHRRSATHSIRDRQYRLVSDPKGKTVAFNRNPRADNNPQKLSLTEYKKENPNAQLIARPAQRIYYDNSNKFRVGDLIRTNSGETTRLTGSSTNGRVYSGKVYFKMREVAVIRKDGGITCQYLTCISDL